MILFASHPYLYSTPGPCFPLSVDRQFLRLVLDTFSASQGKMSLNELGTSRWGSLKKKSENMSTVHISRQGPSFILIKGAVSRFSSSLG